MVQFQFHGGVRLGGEELQNHRLQRRPRVEFIDVESRSRGPAEPYRYEMKAVLKTRMDEKPSVPCGALPDVRAATAKCALRGINQRLPCGA
jgi:hypothetical protein